MPEPITQITIISDLLKRDPAYKEVIDQFYNSIIDKINDAEEESRLTEEDKKTIEESKNIKKSDELN